MKELDVVVDVRPSPDPTKLIVTKQKVTFTGDLIGPPVETRVPLLTLETEVPPIGNTEDTVR